MLPRPAYHLETFVTSLAVFFFKRTLASKTNLFCNLTGVGRCHCPVDVQVIRRLPLTISFIHQLFLTLACVFVSSYIPCREKNRKGRVAIRQFVLYSLRYCKL